MDELPELPFELVLSYLNLEDLLKARAVSRRWYHKINSFRVKSLCYSQRSSDFIFEKNRWVSGAFTVNFINSIKFTSFFDTFGQTILSTLKHLRLCDLDLIDGDSTAFARTLNSLGQLEQLDIIRVEFYQPDLFLSLPMLTSLQLKNVDGIENLTLEAPRLRDVKILACYGLIASDSIRLSVEIVHGESVERLLIDWLEYTKVKKLKNLKVLYIGEDPIERDGLSEDIDPTFLFSLQQLKEIHTNDPRNVSELFERKRQYNLVDLKIYLCGLLLNGPHDPAINALNGSFSDNLSGEWLVCLTENQSRQADEIPFYIFFDYSAIEAFSPGLEFDLLKRFTDWNEIRVSRRVQEIQCFLDLLKNCENISMLSFTCYQPQDLFDRLPEYCAVQKLTINRRPSDLTFLFRLKHLIHLDIERSIDIKTIRRALEELPVLSHFRFSYGQETVEIEIDQSKQFHVSIYRNKKKTVSDLNAAIEFITGKER